MVGEGVLYRGVAPDIYIPWTPEECRGDPVMDAAEQWLRKL